MSRLFSPKKVAQAIGVSESSLKRWCDRGIIESTKTAGGHRRVSLDAVLRFVRETGQGVSEPELLGLPAGSGRFSSDPGDAADELLAAMVRGSEDGARQIVMGLYINGASIDEICDSVITPVFHRIGDLWDCGSVEVFEERRSCDLCMKILHDLRLSVGLHTEDCPVALGATIDGDPYTIASTMVELVLRDVGWNASSLGYMLPFETLHQAIRKCRPDLLWISISSIEDSMSFSREFNALFETARQCGAAVLVGGRALTPEARAGLQYSAFCDNFRQVRAFAETIRPSTRRGYRVDGDRIVHDV